MDYVNSGICSFWSGKRISSVLRYAAGITAMASALLIQGCIAAQSYSMNDPVDTKPSDVKEIRFSVPNDYDFISATGHLWELEYNDNAYYNNLIPKMLKSIGVCTGYAQRSIKLDYDGREIPFYIRIATKAYFRNERWWCEAVEERDPDKSMMEVYRAVPKTEQKGNYRDYIIQPSSADRLFDYETDLWDDEWVGNALEYQKRNPTNLISLLKEHNNSLIVSVIPHNNEFDAPYNVASTVSSFRRNPSVHGLKVSEGNDLCYTGKFASFMGYEGKKISGQTPNAPQIAFSFEVCPNGSSRSIIRLTSNVGVTFSPDIGHVDLRLMTRSIKSLVVQASR